MVFLVFNIRVEKSISLSTVSNPCETSRAQYPDNIQGAALAKRMEEQGCITPFVKNQNATCKTIENANSIYSRMARVQDNFLYLFPCHVFKTKVLLESKYIDEEMEEGQSILLKLPSKLISTQDTLSYTFLSFMAEFGSWLGLFTGLAVVQVHF